MGRTWRPTAAGAALILAMGVAACSSSTSTAGGGSAGRGGSTPAALDEGSGSGAGPGFGWDCPGGRCDWTESGRAAKSRARESNSDVASSPAPDDPDGSLTPAGPRQSTKPGAPGSGHSPSIDDNAEFDAYLGYVSAFRSTNPNAAVETVALANRTLVRVVDGDGKPVLGAEVEVSDGAGSPVATARTYADGRAVFFPAKSGELRIVASAGSARSQSRLATSGTDLDVVLPVTTEASPPQLDVVFLVDATTSMRDDLDQVEASIDKITGEMSSLATSPRFGMTLYRDGGDLFRTRTFDLTSDLAAFRQALAEVDADGGGDTPEDLTSGLHDALDRPSWRSTNTIKVVVLIGDAAPHVGGGSSYTQELARAHSIGIKVLSVGASGIDEPGRFVFRQFAQQTLGRYLSPDRAKAADPQLTEALVARSIRAEFETSG